MKNEKQKILINPKVWETVYDALQWGSGVRSFILI